MAKLGVQYSRTCLQGHVERFTSSWFVLLGFGVFLRVYGLGFQGKTQNLNKPKQHQTLIPKTQKTCNLHACHRGVASKLAQQF